MTTATDEYNKTLADFQTQFPKIEGNAAQRKHFENGAWFGYQLAVADIERLKAELLRNHYFDEARASHSRLEEALRTVPLIERTKPTQTKEKTVIDDWSGQNDSDGE